jgi:hypothetical protein
MCRLSQMDRLDAGYPCWSIAMGNPKGRRRAANDREGRPSPASSSPRSRAAAPRKLRKRFVTRAAFLKEHKPFLTALDDTIVRWNAEYPQYAIPRRTHVPDDPLRPDDNPEYPPSLGFVYPPALQAANDEDYRRSIERTWELARAGLQPEWRTNDAITLALTAWQLLVKELCTTWWPPEDYPNWLHHHKHPATRFVSACLLWEPREVPEEWVQEQNIEIHRATIDPRDPSQSPQAQMWLKAWANLQVRLRLIFSLKSSLTIEDVDPLMQDAWLQAWREAQEQVGTPTGGSFAFFVIPPGMTSQDWRAMEPYAVAAAERSLYERAHSLEQAGMSRTQIANQLGVSRRRVQQILDPR